jgi:hypothetical protein
MKHFILAPLCIFAVCAIGVLCAAEEVKWHPQWNVGDQFNVELVKERTTGPKEKNASNKGRMLLDIIVREKGKDFYIVHCTYGKFEMEGAQKDNPLVVKMLNLSEGICLKIKTDEDGMPQELTNTDEIVKKSLKAIDLLEEFLKDNKLPGATVDQIISPMRTMYKENPEMVTHVVLNEIAPLFLFCGAKLELGSPSEFDELLPNPFQGEPLPGKGSILFKDFDKQTGIAAIEYRLSVDKEKAAPLLFAALKKMDTKASVPADEEIPQIDFSDITHYRIDTKKGWALSVEHSRDIKLDGQTERVQSLLFKTLKDKK